MQAGQAEEHRAVDAARDVEAFVDDQVGVFIGLAAQEAQAQQDGDDQPALEGITVIAANGVLRPVGGEAAGDEHHGQNHRQREGGHPLEARRQARAGGPRVREDAVVEVLGEERPEHHRLGDDEQDDAERLVARAAGDEHRRVDEHRS